MLLKNINIIDPLINLDVVKDVLIEDGLIKKIDDNIDLDVDDNLVYDMDGLVLAPSFFDTHVHFRDFNESDKETYETGSVVALRGGYTDVCAMANSKPPIDSISKYREVQEKIKDLPIDIYQSVNMTKGMRGSELTDFKAIKEAGVKCITDDGIPIGNEQVMIEALKLSKKYDIVLSLHEEDPSFISHSGYDDTAPRGAEINIIKRDLNLLREYGGRINIQHLSSKESVDMIREAKKSGLNLTCEVTPSHLYFTKDMVEKYGTLLKVNPPVREESDRLALIEGLKDGTIDMIASDHAPHTDKDKLLGKFESKSGLISLETLFSVAITKLYKTNIMSLMEIIRRVSTNPRKLFGIENTIEEGQVADLVVFNPNSKYLYNFSHSKSKNTPLLGKELYGEIIMTIKNGKVLYNNFKGGV